MKPLAESFALCTALRKNCMLSVAGGGSEADAKKARLKLTVLLVSAASTKEIRQVFDRQQESLYTIIVGSFWIFIARLFE